MRRVRLPVPPWPGDAGSAHAGKPTQHDTAEAATVPVGAAVDIIVGGTIFRLPVADMVGFTGMLGELPPDHARATYIDAIPKLMADVGLSMLKEPIYCSANRAVRPSLCDDCPAVRGSRAQGCSTVMRAPDTPVACRCDESGLAYGVGGACAPPTRAPQPHARNRISPTVNGGSSDVS